MSSAQYAPYSLDEGSVLRVGYAAPDYVSSCGSEGFRKVAQLVRHLLRQSGSDALSLHAMDGPVLCYELDCMGGET